MPVAEVIMTNHGFYSFNKCFTFKLFAFLFILFMFLVTDAARIEVRRIEEENNMCFVCMSQNKTLPITHVCLFIRA